MTDPRLPELVERQKQVTGADLVLDATKQDVEWMRRKPTTPPKPKP